MYNKKNKSFFTLIANKNSNFTKDKYKQYLCT